MTGSAKQSMGLQSKAGLFRHFTPRNDAFSVMAGLVPAIHVLFSADQGKTWMPGTSSAKTRFAFLPGHDD